MEKETRRNIFFAIYIIIAITLLGFFGYLFGFLGFIYNVMMPEAFSNFSIITLSVIFGIAAFFSPCAFTVLPAYVSHFLTGGDKETNLSRSLMLGFVGALGIVLVNMIVGLIIALLGSATPFAKDPRDDIPIILAVRIIAGIIITFLGVFTIMGRTINIPLMNKILGKAGFTKSIFLYGIFYNAAAIGCTGPIMLGLMLYAFTSGSFASAIIAFSVFSMTMGLLMIIMTFMISIFRQAIVRKFVHALPVIKIIAGIVMIIVGLFLTILTLEGNKIFVDIFFPFLK